MAEQKTIGQKLYELINPCKAGDPIRPAMWDEVDEDYHAHYERAAAAFLNSEAAASAVWDQAVEACIKSQKAAIDEAVSEMNELAMLGAKPLWNSLISRFDDLPEALAALKRSDKTENANV